MSLNNMEEVKQVCRMSNPGKCRIWKKKTMRTCNKNSTPQLAAHVTKMQQISIYLAVNFTFKYITDAQMYVLTVIPALLFS